MNGGTRRMNEELNLEVWDRLFRGESLKGLTLATVNGRIDLRGMALPDATTLRSYQFKTSTVSEIAPGAIFQNAKWENLDFSNSRISSIRFFSSEIRNCLFVNCQLQDLRLWSCTVLDTSFEAANLKAAALGGIQDGKRNKYLNVDFTSTDMREIACSAAIFEKCTFRNAILAKIDFDSSMFSDCLFEGELRDVIFNRHGFNGKGLEPNEMTEVDFTRAKLRHVAFRGLSLATVKLPNDSDHIVINDYTNVLHSLLGRIQLQSKAIDAKIASYLKIRLRSSIPNQAQGVLNMLDLAEIAGEEAPGRLRKLLEK